ncbi:MAG: hypothetical protein PHV20_01315 [Bacteroidales bacterium]|nr:hypothetical protein [Bacteroidales bacterium]
MKKIILLFVSILIVYANSYAQESDNQGKKHFDLENFKAQKMAYLVQQIGITPEESAQFFPLYNEMQEKKFKLKMEAMKNARKIFKKQDPSDEECLKTVDGFLDNEVEIASLEKNYYQKFKKILSPQKLLKLKRADFHFAQEVLKKVDKRVKQRDKEE